MSIQRRLALKQLIRATGTCLALLTATLGQGAEPVAPLPTRTIEIYQIVPGKQQEFLQFIAKADEANRRAGLPPRELYVHADGSDWDFILIQAPEPPADKVAALEKAWVELGLPMGSSFFFEIRKFIAGHSDSKAKGPTTAAAFLAH